MSSCSVLNDAAAIHRSINKRTSKRLRALAHVEPPRLSSTGRMLAEGGVAEVVLPRREGGGFGLALVDVSAAAPRLLGHLPPGPGCLGCGGHGMAYDPARQRAFMVSAKNDAVTSVDVRDPQRPRVLATARNSSWLHYGIHAAFDARRSVLFATQAGGGHPESRSCPARPWLGDRSGAAG